VIAPNMEKPTISPSRLEMVNTRPRNSDSGITGSAAPRSTTMNSATATSAPAPSPRIVGEAHGYWVPPQVVSSTTHTTAAASSAVPR
jgi:hypothetical protein